MKAYHNPKIIGQAIERTIWQARVYHALLSKLIVSLRNENIYQECRTIFEYFEMALETQYILCLSKIFDDTKKGSLWQLLKIIESSSEEDFESKLKKYPTAPHNSMRQTREILLQNIKEVEMKIKNIHKKLSPLRNIDRAHSIPWMTTSNEKITWGATLEWLSFAEKTLEQGMDSLCEGSLRAGDYDSNEFKAEIGHFLKIIKRHK